MNMHVGKFKVGQRVRLTESVGLASVGATATVASFEGKWMRVNWDRNGLDGDQMDGGYYPHSFEPAPLFAVGDKVRCPSTPEAGVGIIESVKPEGGYRVNYKDTWFAVCHGDDTDLAPAYTACAAAEVDNLAEEYGGGRKFKIGDRVNWTRVRGKFDGSTIDAIDSSGTWPVTIRAASGEHTYAALSELEHVTPATATTIRIEAGRHYTTRDGRKVGPMTKFYDHTACFGSDGLGKGGLWHGDGAPWFESAGKDGGDSPALIAEWQDDVPLRGVSPVVATATTAKFKVGDRVWQKGWRDDYWCTVTSVNTTSITIKDDNGHSSPYDNLGDFIIAPTSIADIVRKHGGTAIVCLIENGQPKPSTLPFVHLNKDAAATEAARLAGIHKGQEFGVYACVDVRKVERVYEHEWQRLAAGGQKINAIRELRGITGLGLATTKGAVEDWLKREAA